MSSHFQDVKALQDYRENTYAIAVSVFAFTGMIGSLLVGPVVKKFGRSVK